MMQATANILRNLSAAALASLMLGGCYYGDVYGASSYATYDCAARYGDEYWSNDPCAYDDATYGYDCYDAADYHSGFVQIGFGGGWHQNLYYPGYGLFLFDRYGRRHGMSHDYLTYWGGRRAWWQHHGRHGRKGDHYRGDGTWSDGHRPGRGYRRGDRGGNAPTPPNGSWGTSDNGESPRGRPRGEGYEGRPRRGDGSWTPPVAGESAPSAASPRVPRTNIPVRSSSNAGAAPAPRSAPPPSAAPTPSYTPPPARPAPPPRDGGGRVRED
jgi:hypothetical protein